MSGFLLDTNVPSELTRLKPDPQMTRWIGGQANEDFHLSVISIGELRRGFTILPPGKRRMQLESWFEQYLLPLFADRILPITHAIGSRWGVLSGECHLRGTAIATADGLIAATALEHDLALVTRNVRDFAGLGVTILNPWENAP